MQPRMRATIQNRVHIMVFLVSVELMKHWNRSCLCCAIRWCNRGLHEWNVDPLRMHFHAFVWSDVKVSANLKSRLPCHPPPVKKAKWTYSNSPWLQATLFRFLRRRLRALPRRFDSIDSSWAANVIRKRAAARDEPANIGAECVLLLKSPRARRESVTPRWLQ